MTDENPTNDAAGTSPPAEQHTPPADQPTPPPADPPKPPETEHKTHDDGPILAAIGELKNMVTGLATIQSTPDTTPAKRPWFARGGKS